MAQHVLIYYHVPSDHDDMIIPNAFAMALPEGSRELKLKQLRKSFPLPGTYHFRFKMKWEGDGKCVWMDITNGESVIPKYEDNIVAKVLRLSWLDTAQPSGQPAAAGSKAAQPQRAVGTRSPAPPSQITTTPTNQGNLLGDLAGSPSNAKAAAHSPPSASSGIDDLFGGQQNNLVTPSTQKSAKSAAQGGLHSGLDDLFG